MRCCLSSICPASHIFTYDDIGDIVSKTGVGSGNYNYPQPGANVQRPHAVLSITGLPGTFQYDANGNMTSDPYGRSSSWNSFDMPYQITMSANGSTSSSQFVYGPEHQRTRQNRGDGSMIVYAGSMEIVTQNNSSTIKTYWPDGLGVEIDAGTAATTLNWTHTDNLGSVVAITGSTGTLEQSMAYDPWGARRDLAADPGVLHVDASGNLAGQALVDNKGFTDQEMLDQLNLVHLNGRVYDPLLGRFLSADPEIQDPTHSQSYNRYTYVWNNPTNLTDPSGFAATQPTPPSDPNASHISWECAFGSSFCGVADVSGSLWGSSASAATSKSAGQANAKADNSNTTTTGPAGNINSTGGGISCMFDGSNCAASIASSNIEPVTDSKPWGSYLPGTAAGDSAAQWYADRQEKTGNLLWAIPGSFAALWTPDTAVETSVNLFGGEVFSGAKMAFGYADAKIIGTAQATGTMGHAVISDTLAYFYALNPDVTRVTLDLGYRRLMEGTQEMVARWGPRPDVGILFNDATARVIEVASKTDVPEKLMQRNATKMTREGIQGTVSVNNWAVWIDRLFGN